MKSILNTAISLLVLFSAQLQADVNLAFGIYASDKPTTMVSMFRPILNVLETRMTAQLNTPVNIKLQVANNYDKGIADLVSGKVDFARMGPASYIISKENNPGLQLLAMENKQGSKTFYGVICVPSQSDVQSIEQLKGKSFAFGNKNSTIGRYLSQYLLATHNVYANNLAKYGYLDRHDRVGSAVGTGQFDAGALKESTFKKLRTKGIPIREIARFPNVTKPWIASAQLSPEILAALKTALLEFNDKKALKKLKKDGFLPAKDSDYDLIRESIQKNADFFQPEVNG